MNPRRPGGTAPPTWLAVWWDAFLVNGWIANIALRSVGGDETPQAFRESAIAYLVSDGLDVAMALPPYLD